jgi:hypothetical protein
MPVKTYASAESRNAGSVTHGDGKRRETPPTTQRLTTAKIASKRSLNFLSEKRQVPQSKRAADHTPQRRSAITSILWFPYRAASASKMNLTA